jgi:hypothetical protein
MRRDGAVGCINFFGEALEQLGSTEDDTTDQITVFGLLFIPNSALNRCFMERFR